MDIKSKYKLNDRVYVMKPSEADGNYFPGWSDDYGIHERGIYTISHVSVEKDWQDVKHLCENDPNRDFDEEKNTYILTDDINNIKCVVSERWLKAFRVYNPGDVVTVNGLSYGIDFISWLSNMNVYNNRNFLISSRAGYDINIDTNDQYTLTYISEDDKRKLEYNVNEYFFSGRWLSLFGEDNANYHEDSLGLGFNTNDGNWDNGLSLI